MTKNEANGIWVFAEQKNGVLDKTPLELISKALELKQTTGEEVTALLVGSDVAELADTLIAYGADKVIVAENENLKSYSGRPYQKVVADITAKYKPSIFIFPATAQGRDLAPRVMCTLGTGLTADAVDLGFDDEGAFVQTTPAFGGSLLAHIAIPELRPQMVTVRAHVFDALEPDFSRKGEVIVETVEVEADSDYEVLSVQEKVKNGVAIHEAEVLVAGGRGTFSGENAVKSGQTVLFVTERAVFELDNDGIILTEIAPGIDLQTQVLDMIDFDVRVSPNLKLMDARIFAEGPMGLELK